jgi:hypothetical protein
MTCRPLRYALALCLCCGVVNAADNNVKVCDSISAAIDRAQRRAAMADARMFAESAPANKARYATEVGNQISAMQANFVLAGLHKCPLPTEAVEVPRPYKRSSIACAAELLKSSRLQDGSDACNVLDWKKDDESVK